MRIARFVGTHVVQCYRHGEHDDRAGEYRGENKAIAQAVYLGTTDHGDQGRGPPRWMHDTKIMHEYHRDGDSQRRCQPNGIGYQLMYCYTDYGCDQLSGQDITWLSIGAVRQAEDQYCCCTKRTGKKQAALAIQFLDLGQQCDGTYAEETAEPGNKGLEVTGTLWDRVFTYFVYSPW